MFASRKLPFRDLLLLIAHFVNAVEGISALRLKRELEVSYKTAFTRLHKLREVLMTHQQSNDLRGKVEIDGAYFGGHIRPRNHRPKQVDRRRKAHRSSKRQCVVIFRERWGRSRPIICSESVAALRAHEIIEYGSEVFTDANTDFNRLAARYILRMVNHSERYADGEVSTNWAESYFRRLRCCERGVHHHVSGEHLAEYANEISWREDRRCYDNKENFEALLGLATRHPVSRKWKGYWQRRRAAA